MPNNTRPTSSFGAYNILKHSTLRLLYKEDLSIPFVGRACLRPLLHSPIDSCFPDANSIIALILDNISTLTNLRHRSSHIKHDHYRLLCWKRSHACASRLTLFFFFFFRSLFFLQALLVREMLRAQRVVCARTLKRGRSTVSAAAKSSLVRATYRYESRKQRSLLPEVLCVGFLVLIFCKIDQRCTFTM